MSTPERVARVIADALQNRLDVALAVDVAGDLQQRLGARRLGAQGLFGAQPVGDVDGDAGHQRRAAGGVGERELVGEPVMQAVGKRHRLDDLARSVLEHVDVVDQQRRRDVLVEDLVDGAADDLALA